VRSLAEPVAYGRRREFLQAVAAALAACSQSGPSVIYRVAMPIFTLVWQTCPNRWLYPWGDPFGVLN
jgi:hypothetical protein